ncbi:9939_t:CDS:2 [Funneliformis mosseae]|uniref:9939_t:CDS:1 n=1 Tax=Funneliformis mosseae TaxID=27381 RepID=A0A9N9E9P0_FUNMO|nr:9939_t:CDS:2 [Funneliformis mosseae]
MATKIPTEIIIEICLHLTPNDLYSLSSVCRKYRSLLWSTTTTTQDIWRLSRLSFVPNLTLPPPFLHTYNKEPLKRMSEQQYIWLMTLCEKCHFCDQTNKMELTMYWEGKFYSCVKCLTKRVISGETLKSKWKVPEKLLQCLQELPKSFDIICWQPQTFLISEVINLLKEYDQLKKHERNDWIEKKKREIERLQGENETYRELHDEF